MSNRRKFLLQTVAAGGALAFHRAAIHAAAPVSSKPLRLLILGGTGFIGPHFVKAALDRGHQVSVFDRGGGRGDLPATVERLSGDRNGDLRSIQNRDWDAVFDLATYVPEWVRSLGQALQGRVRHYTFISTIVTYQYPGATDEKSKVVSYDSAVDPYSLTSFMPPPGQYGALKVLCEQEAERQFPGKALVLRSGHIVGPRERIGALTYWVARMAQGGEILAGGDPSIPVQYIDIRDFAEWAVRMAEQGDTGTFNTVGPALPTGWGEMLGALRGAARAPATLTWVPIPWLLERKVAPASALLFWPAESGGIPGIWQLSNQKARAHGLTFRPLTTTILDTVTWYQSLPPEQQTGALLAQDGTNRTLQHSMACERQLLAAWHAQEKTSRG